MYVSYVIPARKTDVETEKFLIILFLSLVGQRK